MNTISHSEMVATLAKPGDTLVSELTGNKAHLWHMASALMGEACELIEAYDNAFTTESDVDQENLVEELGDAEFYIEGIRQGLGIERVEAVSADIDPIILQCHGFDSVAAIKFTIATSKVFDLIKKYVIYNKELVQGVPTNPKKQVSVIDIQDALAKMEAVLFVYRLTTGFDYQQTLDANIEKLRERYEGFVYTDQAAQDRADKAVAE